MTTREWLEAIDNARVPEGPHVQEALAELRTAGLIGHDLLGPHLTRKGREWLARERAQEARP